VQASANEPSAQPAQPSANDEGAQPVDKAPNETAPAQPSASDKSAQPVDKAPSETAPAPPSANDKSTGPDGAPESSKSLEGTPSVVTAPAQAPTMPPATDAVAPTTAPAPALENPSIAEPVPPQAQQPPVTPSETAIVPFVPAATPPIRSTPPSAVPTETVQATAIQPTPRTKYFGIGLDLGISGILPDAGLLLAGRPVRPIHVQLGAGFNGIGYGIRGGLTLINPYFIPLSLTWEGGHYFESDANRAVRWFSKDTQDVASLKRFSYDYMNLLAGIALENRSYAFYLRAGVTWMRTTVKDFQQSVNDVAHTNLVASDPKIRYRGPTLKLGMIFFL
jgi:hypothetical protein